MMLGEQQWTMPGLLGSGMCNGVVIVVVAEARAEAEA
jgi:hypothetical protein